jgi:hypothetical protein
MDYGFMQKHIDYNNQKIAELNESDAYLRRDRRVSILSEPFVLLTGMGFIFTVVFTLVLMDTLGDASQNESSLIIPGIGLIVSAAMFLTGIIMLIRISRHN